MLPFHFFFPCVYMCGCMSTWVCVHVCACAYEGPRLISRIFYSSFTKLRQGLSNPERSDTDGLSKQTAVDFPVCAVRAGPPRPPTFCMYVCMHALVFRHRVSLYNNPRCPSSVDQADQELRAIHLPLPPKCERHHHPAHLTSLWGLGIQNQDRLILAASAGGSVLGMRTTRTQNWAGGEPHVNSREVRICPCPGEPWPRAFWMEGR